MTYLGVYTLILAFLWGLFIVAKIHAYKFKTFSLHIKKVTNFLLIVLLTLSILGYVLIFMSGSSSTNTVKNYESFETKEINY